MKLLRVGLGVVVFCMACLVAGQHASSQLLFPFVTQNPLTLWDYNDMLSIKTGMMQFGRDSPFLSGRDMGWDWLMTSHQKNGLAHCIQAALGLIGELRRHDFRSARTFVHTRYVNEPWPVRRAGSTPHSHLA